MKNILFVLSILIFTSTSCVKDSDELAFELAPKIELLSISNDTIVQFTEQLVINIKYEDGDGDLGTTDPDVNSIFVQDQRLENPDEYYLGPLAPPEASISIQGTINLELSNTFLLGNGNQETTVFTIHFFDRAGNQSNVIETDPITILRN